MGLKNIILAVFLIAITITALISTVSVSNKATETHMQAQTLVAKEPPRVSRFLAQNAKNGRRNAKATDHCNKNEEICKSQGSSNSTMACCSNKCVDVAYDNDNCGACNNQCKFTQTCCGGECVYLAYDKRHCGECNHRCLVGNVCVYGLCNYA
ncbi:Stigma-specific STIG1-like protein 3 [Hirschfeldia incana]|nr:Stigma-specific STIG1-like protein 3 [Hirschfeldia incana]